MLPVVEYRVGCNRDRKNKNSLDKSHRTGCAGKAGEVLWMRVPYDQGLASQVGPESCVAARKSVGEALTGGDAGWDIEPRKYDLNRGADAVLSGGRPQRPGRKRQGQPHPAWSKTPCTHPGTLRGSREIPDSATPVSAWSAS